MADANQDKEPPEFWTTSKRLQWLHTHFGIKLCRETIRTYLKKLGFSWKKSKKLLNKANPEKREEFLDQLRPLIEQANEDKVLLVYLDEAHKHPDPSLG